MTVMIMNKSEMLKQEILEKVEQFARVAGDFACGVDARRMVGLLCACVDLCEPVAYAAQDRVLCFLVSCIRC